MPCKCSMTELILIEIRQMETLQILFLQNNPQVFVLCLVCLCAVSCAQCCLSRLSIAPLVFSNIYLLQHWEQDTEQREKTKGAMENLER
jgi:hypothetical protein